MWHEMWLLGSVRLIVTKVCIFINKDDERLLSAMARDETTKETNEKSTTVFLNTFANL